jgi:hypothetical protein
MELNRKFFDRERDNISQIYATWLEIYLFVWTKDKKKNPE